VNLRIVEPGFETTAARLEAYRELLGLLSGTRSALHSDAIKLARAERGKTGGTPSTLTLEQWPAIKESIRTEPLEAVASELGVSRQTLWTYRRRMEAEDNPAGPSRAGTGKRRG
jgi:DNA invertase Pin-like site-specific DNA recombinase